MKIAILIGTRPEIIKMSPLIKAIQNSPAELLLIHSNQHYSNEMDATFFDELGLPAPDFNLNVGSGKHSNQTGNILIKLEPILEDEKPEVLLVQGDTNTVLAGGLAASKIGIKVGHVEAGLRSYDRKMPEETNRVIVDHLSDYLFAVSNEQKRILLSEGIPSEKIYVVGNSIVDSLFESLNSKNDHNVLESLSLEEKEYFLFTAHRVSNVDDFHSLNGIVKIIKNICERYKKPVVWPIHPRAKNYLFSYGIELPDGVKMIEPTGYSDFLSLEKNALLILTDSGGVQEEACILKTPCLTLRENTERPETVDVGANIIVGRDMNKIINGIEHFKNLKSDWENPFGNGTTSSQILNILLGNNQGEVDPHHVCVVGLGYMGLPMAFILASNQNKVVGYDIDNKKVESLKKGVLPFEEKGVDELFNSLKPENISFENTIPASGNYIISVPTPHKDNACDLSMVKAACVEVAKVCPDEALIIIESTIKPGTCINEIMPIFKEAGLNIHLAHCPERAIPGNTVSELVNNDRIIGGVSPLASEKALRLYKTFSRGNLHIADVTTAECCKLMENTYRDVNIALANEMDLILFDYGVKTGEAIRLANCHPRVNFLQAGPGVGGHCIAVDPYFLIEGSKHASLIKSARAVNENRPQNIVKRLVREIDSKKKIGVLGVAYKKNVGDCRETPAKEICESLLSAGYEIKIHDPFVQKWVLPLSSKADVIDFADVFIILADHDIFETEYEIGEVINLCRS